MTSEAHFWPEAIFRPSPRVSAAEGPAEKVRRQGLFFRLLGWCRRGSLVYTASILTRLGDAVDV